MGTRDGERERCYACACRLGCVALVAGHLLGALMPAIAKDLDAISRFVAPAYVAMNVTAVCARRDAAFLSLTSGARGNALHYAEHVKNEAIESLTQEEGVAPEIGGTTRLRRRMVERVLTSCAGMPAGDIEPLMTLLRRYATEAAREEARLFCDELVDIGNVIAANDYARTVVAA